MLLDASAAADDTIPKLMHSLKMQGVGRASSLSMKAACLLSSLLFASSVQAWQMKQAPLMSRWASLVDTNNPLPEYPRPQMVRTQWLSLNGIWQFQAGATNDSAPTNQTLS